MTENRCLSRVANRSFWGHSLLYQFKMPSLSEAAKMAPLIFLGSKALCPIACYSMWTDIYIYISLRHTCPSVQCRENNIWYKSCKTLGSEVQRYIYPLAMQRERWLLYKGNPYLKAEECDQLLQFREMWIDC